jgi:glutamine---fructose-6-phosphate transaminase (isomerizing)
MSNAPSLVGGVQARPLKNKERFMCGIVGAISERNITNPLLMGLKRLEYRGYDSAGIAVINEQGQLERQRVKGKVAELRELFAANPISGTVGIAHTRWATHGQPDGRNAHPHFSNDEVAVVHNGIIENHQALRERLVKNGYYFHSETDSEVVSHLIHEYLQQDNDLITAVQKTIDELDGSFAIAVLYVKEPNQIIAVRRGSPLVIGLGLGENFLASDHFPLLAYTDRFIYLEEGDVAELTINDVTVFDESGKKVKRPVHVSDVNIEMAEKGRFRHYMAKEIFEQPDAIRATLDGRLSAVGVMPEIFGENAPDIFSQVKHIQIVACGTSYHAGMIARYWIEDTLKIPCSVEIASEFRYRNVVIPENSLFVTISQSGETADTLAALRQAKHMNFMATLAICNVPESSLVRESDLVFMTRAGVEIGVASTKAFTTQLTALLMMIAAIGRQQNANVEHFLEALNQLPRLSEVVLGLDENIEKLAKRFIDKNHALFLGRGTHYPVALEGALKLKEISYIHAEAYPAGELKHGPLALVDKEMPVIAVAPNDQLLEKLKSNLHEVRARGGELIVFADESADLENSEGVFVEKMPAKCGLVTPIIYTIPLQLLAYHVAVLKGTDVDQPRNLAKSVTVE